MITATFHVKKLYKVTVWIVMNPATRFLLFFFFFFFLRMNSNLTWFAVQRTKITIYALFITVHALKNIKNGSYGIIYTFKNYFATVLSVFSFSNNKFNPNGPIISKK